MCHSYTVLTFGDIKQDCVHIKVCYGCVFFYINGSVKCRVFWSKDVLCWGVKVIVLSIYGVLK